MTDENCQEPEAAMEMPRYICHKQVWALKIEAIDSDADGAMIQPAEADYAAFKVDAEYINKHNPEVGGYYVVYKDGYKSYSPEKAFEEGYKAV